uniref:protein FAM174C-like isoform X1 n=2 Tax=Pristiophorus japonicus TaxID=55135 RepID=UPI00398E4839
MKLGGAVFLVLAAALGLSLLLLPVAAGPEIPRAEARPGNSTARNSSGGGKLGSPHSLTPPALRRALWVLLGVSGIGGLYLTVRGLRTARLKKTQRKKYGLLSSYDDHVEMAPMDTDDDDTIFEAKSMRRSISYTASQSC